MGRDTSHAESTLLDRITRPGAALLGMVVGLGLLAAAGCVDEEVVFRERPLFEEPPEAAGEFLGYSDQDAKLTVCGNCHQGMQSGWETTGHADAWAGLQSSGHANESCEGCHTVNELGNDAEGDLGWTSTGDTRYHDVQCESCHGPGETHVNDPDATQPLASILAGTNLETGCGECHQGAHHPFVEQWQQSAHGQVPAQPIAASVGSFCLPCHEGRTALQQVFNETTDYQENQPTSSAGNQPILCSTCHDPHGSANRANLRAPIEVASRNHLCVRCHSREGTPDTNGDNAHGPHAFQGLLVLGQDVGWVPPGADFSTADSIVSTHGTEANEGLCATCHVSQTEITDSQTGDFLVQSVGHTFDAIPCLDDQGLPATGCTLSERDFSGCTGGGCHSTESVARSALTTVRTRLDDLLDQLWDDADGDHVLETTDGGQLPQVLALQGPDEINPFDATFTTAEGALWNAQVAFTDENPHWGDGQVAGLTEHFGSHKGSGEGVHNPFLLELLLRASIDAVQAEYGVSPSPRVDLSPRLTPPPGVSLR